MVISSKNQSNVPSGASRVVLVVDDDRVNLRLIEVTLTHHNYIVKTAQSGEEAIKILAELVPSAMVLDVMMSGISGLELCRIVKQEARLKKVPVIFLTAQDAPGDYKAGHELGAVLYMVKPVKPEQLLRMIEMVCIASSDLPDRIK